MHGIVSIKHKASHMVYLMESLLVGSAVLVTEATGRYMSVKGSQAFSTGGDLGESWAESKAQDVSDRVEAVREADGVRESTYQAFGGMVNQIVGGIFAVALGLIMLNELLTLSIVDNSTGPFSSVFDTLESVGGAAMIFIVLGFLAAAGGVAVRMFRGGGI
jgi:hypothetical protein